ncbi:LacI family DNA-binding transcriptional regulator [Fictibacillus phosphorivorans]|uniref:LacI family DNA-binding transcriptional regulator n=1 Tax=Fictibacillus phosphorivorans TaxID=1221500 RepID=UPI00203B3151|nr:LacI family DNA-binding transcriptional regulator [Fictibacillus phosphorivorans]MCM3719019.1 LacI family transcriptional regulator [Fictibacillus phosphorivorans]MCM3776641.1 LacI family transcriptional regulator [Fictibacillus phosphorivorans]
MVSIKDIAKKAGVSISTVSYALNGSPKVTKETSERIQAIAKELNYIPSAAARSLKKRETKIIGIYLTNYSGAFYGELLQGMMETLSKNGYELIVCSGKESHRFLPERMIDGAIILDATYETEELLSHAERGHKLVVMDRRMDHPNISQVLLDNKAGATLAIDHLAEKGHRKIYVVKGPEISFDARQRLEAVQKAVQRYSQIEYVEIDGNFNKASGEIAAKQIHQEYSEPVGVFCLNDEMAIGVYNYFSRTNLQIGEDVHVIGFDNIEVSQYIHPRLATINYSKHKWGSLASELLLNLISKKQHEHERINVSLIEGASVRDR